MPYPKRRSFVEKAYFEISTQQTITVNTDPLNPSFIGNMSVAASSGMTLVDPLTGCIRNDTGRIIKFMSGTINFNPNKGGGGVSRIHLVSERSSDGGVTWEGNLDSLRVIEISNNGESYGTKLSYVLDWLPGQHIRFRVYSVSGGAVDFVSSTQQIIGQPFTSAAATWELSET